VTELILRCKTTKGVIEKHVTRDAEVVHVSRVIFTSLSSHTSSSASRHGSDGVAVRVVLHEEAAKNFINDNKLCSLPSEIKHLTKLKELMACDTDTLNHESDHVFSSA
jgi:hypothetical protein